MANLGAAGIFRRKTVGQIQAEHENGELKRSLGALNLILLGIGCIIGTGIFVLTGHAAAEWAGPGIMISFVITGLLCGLVALCYAELASALPVSGSAYSYTYASMGEIAAWVMGLLLLLEYGLAASVVAVGWSGYFNSLLIDLHIHLPPALTAAPGVAVSDAAGVVVGTGLVNLPAILVIAAVTSLLVVGIQESATANAIVVFVKLAVVLAFIAIGSRYVHPKLWSPLIPAQVPAPPPGTPTDIGHQIGRALWDVITGASRSKYGVGGVIHGAAVIFFAYLGFEAVSTAGAESRNPARDMPIGILGALVICTVLYIMTSAVLVGIVPYASLDNPAPIATAVNQIGLPWFGVFVKVGAIAGLSSVMLVLLYGQTRIFYTMSKDGLLPPSLAVVHKRFKTPWVNTIIVGVAAAGASGFLSLNALADLTNVGSLSAFALVCITVIYLRISNPELERPFRTPLFPFVPIAGAVMCAFLLMSLMAGASTRNFFLIYLAVGIVVYFLFGVRSSKLAKARRRLGDTRLPRAAHASRRNKPMRRGGGALGNHRRRSYVRIVGWLPKSRRARRRLMMVAVAAPVVGLAAGLAGFALGDAAVFFYSPAQAQAKGVPAGRTVRIGGLVRHGSLTHGADGEVRFTVTDYRASDQVVFRGELPDLFREGQGVVAQGAFRRDGVFEAREVLAKHDERYMPRELTQALKASGQWRPDAEIAVAGGATTPRIGAPAPP